MTDVRWATIAVIIYDEMRLELAEVGKHLNRFTVKKNLISTNKEASVSYSEANSSCAPWNVSESDMVSVYVRI